MYRISISPIFQLLSARSAIKTSTEVMNNRGRTDESALRASACSGVVVAAIIGAGKLLEVWTTDPIGDQEIGKRSLPLGQSAAPLPRHQLS
jgi:hypothetical protein